MLIPPMGALQGEKLGVATRAIASKRLFCGREIYCARLSLSYLILFFS
jgi:hypothetical protein